MKANTMTMIQRKFVMQKVGYARNLATNQQYIKPVIHKTLILAQPM